MGKYRLDTKKTVEYTVIVEADSIEQAERMMDDWVDEDFEPFIIGADWVDGEWQEEED
jgi:hypothetical protein